MTGASTGTSVMYPVALGPDGRIVGIEDWNGTDPVSCPACDERMIGRRGEIVAWHFAHFAECAKLCSGESVLHRAAKLVLAQSFRSAVEAHAPFRLHWDCANCRMSLSYDMTDRYEKVEIEASACEGTRADVLFSGGKGLLAVELVVTHAPEASTLSLYRASGVGVAIVPCSWDSLRTLRTYLYASALIPAPAACAACERRIAERAAAERRRHETRRRFHEWLSISARPGSFAAPKPWFHDRYGNEVYSHVRRRLMATARLLCGSGFRQVSDKPFLFMYDFSGLRLFCDLGGTEIVPIWEDTRALVYWFPRGAWKLGQSGETIDEGDVAEAFFGFCKRKGVPCRISFEADPSWHEAFDRIFGDDQ